MYEICCAYKMDYTKEEKLLLLVDLLGILQPTRQ